MTSKAKRLLRRRRLVQQGLGDVIGGPRSRPLPSSRRRRPLPFPRNLLGSRRWRLLHRRRFVHRGLGDVIGSRRRPPQRGRLVEGMGGLLGSRHVPKRHKRRRLRLRGFERDSRAGRSSYRCNDCIDARLLQRNLVIQHLQELGHPLHLPMQVANRCDFRIVHAEHAAARQATIDNSVKLR